MTHALAGALEALPLELPPGPNSLLAHPARVPFYYSTVPREVLAALPVLEISATSLRRDIAENRSLPDLAFLITF